MLKTSNYTRASNSSTEFGSFYRWTGQTGRLMDFYAGSAITSNAVPIPAASLLASTNTMVPNMATLGAPKFLPEWLGEIAFIGHIQAMPNVG